MRFRRTNTAEAEVDMTSMLDVVFIMLIFFIVTSSFVKESSLSFARPTAAPSIPHASAAPLLTLHADGSLVADGRALDQRAIPAWIEQQRSQAEVTQVVLQANVNASTDDLVRVVDRIKSAGVTKVSVGTFE